MQSPYIKGRQWQWSAKISCSQVHSLRWHWEEKGKMSISWSTRRKTLRSEQSDLLKADAPSEFIVVRNEQTNQTPGVRVQPSCHAVLSKEWDTQVARSFTLQPSSAHLHPDLNRSKASKQMKLALLGRQVVLCTLTTFAIALIETVQWASYQATNWWSQCVSHY